jgi:hypothetical protein
VCLRLCRKTQLLDSTGKLREEIDITIPDGSERKGTSWETSPMDVAKAVSKGLSEKIVIAKVNRC